MRLPKNALFSLELAKGRKIISLTILALILKKKKNENNMIVVVEPNSFTLG